MIKQRWHAAIFLVVACSGGPRASDPVTPVTTARATVERFMQAVADSNLPQMATLWGTNAGPASRTGQPPDWEKRIVVMQSYLRNESHRVLPSTPSGGASENMQVEIRRELCTWIVPFTVIRLGDDSWVVNQVDLTRAGNPARSCVPGGAQDTTTAPQ